MSQQRRILLNSKVQYAIRPRLKKNFLKQTALTAAIQLSLKMKMGATLLATARELRD
jgi:hypothetical protein